MTLDLHIFRQYAKRLWTWLWRKDMLIFLLFVGVTTLFWWGRVMSSPRDMELSVPISYIGMDEQAVFSNELPQTLTLLVRDNGQQLRHIAHQGLNLTINLHPYLSSQEGRLTLTADILRPRLQDMLPGSTIIQHISPEVIESEYQVQQVKEVPVLVQALVTAAPQHHIVGEAHVNPSHVRIYGQPQQLEHIDHITTDTLRVSNLRDSIQLTAHLLAPEGVRLSTRDVQVSWQAEQFTEKSFTLPILPVDVPEGKLMRLFPQQVKVTVRVGISQFSKVQESDFQAVCRYNQQLNALPVEVTTNNPNISNIRISPIAVEYIIQN